MWHRWLGLFMLGGALAGCATEGVSWLSPLGRAVNVQPTQGQSVEVLRQDDAACLAWARATKGKDEPFPTAEMRYGVCMIARGYQVQIGDEPRGARVSLPTPRSLHVVVSEMQTCRVDKAAVGEFDWVGDLVKGRRAMACLATHEYSVTEIERVYPQDSRSSVPSPGPR